MKSKKYRTLADFDVYICGVGRIRVPKGAEYEIQGSKYQPQRIFFLNSQNFLPSTANTLFLMTKREQIN